MVVAFQLKPGDLQGRGHARLLDLAGLGEGRLEVDVGKPCQWVSEAMPGALALDLASVVGSPAPPALPGVQAGELGQLGGNRGPARRGVDLGLLDVGQAHAKGREGRALGRAHKALQGVDHFTLRGGPHYPQLDHLHLLGLDRALIAARRFEVDNEDHATSST